MSPIALKTVTFTVVAAGTLVFVMSNDEPTAASSAATLTVRSTRQRPNARQSMMTLEELKALGVILVLQAADRAFPLKLDSLEQMSTHRKTSRRPKWLLLKVNPATDEQPESAVVWVSDKYRAAFLKLFEDFLERDTPTGKPCN